VWSAFPFGGVLKERAFLLQEHRARSTFALYFRRLIDDLFHAAQDSFATERPTVKTELYELTGIHFDIQEVEQEVSYESMGGETADTAKAFYGQGTETQYFAQATHLQKLYRQPTEPRLRCHDRRRNFRFSQAVHGCASWHWLAQLS
jgi:hypothetical protein